MIILSGTRSTSTIATRAGPRRRAEPARPHRRPDGPQTRDQWFNAAPIGSAGSAFGRPAKGTFGNLGRNALRGPGFWQMDMSVFKNIWQEEGRRLEVRIESVNVFNHVNLGNPDSTIGVPGNNNPNAGKITGTAGNYNPRNFQFGFRFVF